MKDGMYFAPTRIAQALKLLAEYGEKANILAGGTDLVPKINYYELKPEILLYIGELGLDYLKEKKGKLVIGATTSTATLTNNALVAQKASALAEAARQSGSIATRNVGTIGGNLANASPAADLATPLLVMDAKLLLGRAGGKRVVAMKDFFIGPGKTMLQPDEIIIEIYVPSFKGRTIFLKLGRRKAMTLSVANVAVRLEMAGDTCNEVRIAMGAMSPVPMRCTRAEEMLKGRILDKALVNKSATEAVAETNPIDDQRATAWYRKKAGAALVAKALLQAASIDD